MIKVHLIDVLIFAFAVLGVSTVILIEYRNNNSDQNNNSGGGELTCWFPAHFGSSWEEFTNEYCTQAYRDGVTIQTVQDLGPDRKGVDASDLPPQKEGVPDPPPIPTPKGVDAPNLRIPGAKAGSGSDAIVALNDVILAEAILAVVSFVLLQMVVKVLFARVATVDEPEESPARPGENGVDYRVLGENALNRKRQVAHRISGSCVITATYCAILFGATIAWFTLGGLSHGIGKDLNKAPDVAVCRSKEGENCTDPVILQKEAEEEQVRTVMCEFKVRRMGNVQRYSVQCVVEAVKRRAVDGAANEINTAVCFTVAILTALHLVYTLVVAPLVNGRKNGQNNKLITSDADLAITVGAL